MDCRFGFQRHVYRSFREGRMVASYVEGSLAVQPATDAVRIETNGDHLDLSWNRMTLKELTPPVKRRARATWGTFDVHVMYH